MNGLVKQSDLEQIKERFIETVDEKTFIREASFALQAINSNAQLLKCEKSSIQEAVLNVSLTGLTLNPINALAYLVPRWSKNGTRCVLTPSYQGLCKLATDTGSVMQIYSHPVFDEDEFEIGLGTNPEIVHKPAFKTTDVSHVYAVAVLPDGNKQIEVMSREEIQTIMELSEGHKAYKNGKVKKSVWQEWEGEMSRKAVIKRLCKYLPKTEKWDKLNNAIEIDNSDYQSSFGQESYIESLAMSCSLDHEEAHGLIKEVQDGVTANRAKEIISYLKDNQLDPITQSGSPTVTEAKDAVQVKMKEE